VPVIGIPVEMLNERISSRLEPEVMVTRLQQLGCDVEGYATLRRFACQTCQFLMEITETENPPVECQACGKDFKAQPDQLIERGTNEVIRMELLAVRPDMFDPAGLARTLRGYLGEYLGPVQYELAPATVNVEVQAELDNKENPLYRPIRCAIVRGAELDEDRIKVLMKLQENLHWAMGRDRKRASIGVYDLSSFDSARGVYYRLVTPEGLRFVPLGKSEEMTPREVLEKHPKGIDYAHLLAERHHYPMLGSYRADGSEVVMAFIPIINSEETRVVQSSRDLFVDVTGVEERLVEKILNTVVTSLLELCPGSKAERVNIVAPGKEPYQTPDLTPQPVEFDTSLPARRIGIDVDDAQVRELLQKMGHGVKDGPNGKVIVEVPAYRNDILHPVDLVEDVAIAYGYHNIVPSLVPTFTVGVETPRGALMNRVRQALTGLGYHEVLTLILSNEADQFEKLRRPNAEQHVLVSHPISVEQTMVRTSLIPGLLDTFSVNTDHPLPQRIFEVGRISLLDDGQEVGAREHLRVSAAVIGSRADFTEIKAVAESLVRELGLPGETSCRPIGSQDDLRDTFLPGRGAVLERGQTPLVSFGELHPLVLEQFGLGYPVALLEMDLEILL
jgi:phenylalanyl-tRNA synthetase beta chain